MPLNGKAEMRKVVDPTMALILGALMLIGSSRAEAQARSAAQGEFSDASLSGNNEKLEIRGTYEVRPDGTGSASYTATNSAGHTDRVDLDFQIVNHDKIKFQ
jgi:hypothetical protein